MIERRMFSGHGIRDSATATAATPTANDNNNDRGGMAPLTPSSAAALRETTTMTTAMTMMKITRMRMTTIASPTKIESTGAAALVPQLARRGFNVVDFTKLSCAVHKHANTCNFERHRCADVRAC